MRYDPKNFTLGAELELADVDSAKGLPEHFGWDREDVTMVNSNGVAVDPKHKLYRYGGEVNTRPTLTIKEQVECFKQVLRRFPEAQVNYRSNLHIHIGVLGLNKDLDALKRFQVYIHEQIPKIIGELEPIPVPTKAEYPDPDALAGAKKRCKRRRKSHQTLLSARRLEHQLKAKTPEEFFRREVPPYDLTLEPSWHQQARCCVNLRHLREEISTVEFRHFPGTLDPVEFESALQWCAMFTNAALNTNQDAKALYRNWRALGYRMPKFEPYMHELEQGYLLTCRGYVSPRLIPENIKKVLEWRLGQ